MASSAAACAASTSVMRDANATTPGRSGRYCSNSASTASNLRESRIYLVDPAPIPADELQRTFDWMKSWGFLENACEARELVNMSVQQRGYERQSHQDAAVG